MKLFFTLHIVYLFQGSHCKEFLDVVKFRNWPESSKEGTFSCLYQNVPASLENVTIAPLKKNSIYFSFYLKIPVKKYLAQNIIMELNHNMTEVCMLRSRLKFLILRRTTREITQII